ncbi:MAG: PhzF family phenazine biosynthesis protein [Planctomycetes bacterium]|nr:PhzF family phenazine biosynthesis protein [Planctomycetota bacterium]
MPTPLWIVDAFAEKPFTGNPAAVCLLDAARDVPWMQHVAAEMNLSETAFVVPRAGGEDGFDLRWFTPTVEVELCGHATLASAHVLWELRRLERDRVARFHTKSGWLEARWSEGRIELDFPAKVVSAVAAPKGLLESLGAAPVFVGSNKMDYLVELESDEHVRSVAPDFEALKQVEARGVIVTASGSGSYDFVSRFFAPRAGVREDPVTGSAHCALGPYWSAKLGRPKLAGFQASRRGGVVQTTVVGERVLLGGRAVGVVRGELV